MSVKTKYGLVEGVKKDGYTLFMGVPYAKPPVGSLRFKAPEEPDAWEGVYQADHFPNRCPQFDWGDDASNPYKQEFYSVPEYIPPMSEDCLYLNIWAPDDAKDLPVAFWIHGGGFGGGTSCEMEFDGAAYAKKGVILVTINYRLNAFGYLAHPWLTAEDPNGTSGNRGT